MSGPEGDRAHPALRRLEGRGEPWGATIAVASALWALALTQARGESAATIRSLAFAGGPLLLLAGLHARLAGYLHARARLDLLPRPLPPLEHWRLAAPARRRGLAGTLVGGLAGLAIGLGWPTAAGPMLDFAWLCAFAALIEPTIPAIAAWLGRRFAGDGAATSIQRSLAAGWSAPEAAIHLYAPALGIGLAALLAMPGQLALEHRGAAPSALPWLLGPLAVAAALRLVAPSFYARGLWEAAPRLHESIRSLAGPPDGAPAPAFFARLAPTLRLELLQWLRLRPLAMARLVALLAWTAVILVRADAPGAPHLAVGLALVGLWGASWTGVLQERRRRARLLAALPLPDRARAGGLSGASLVVAMTPAIVFVGAFVARGGVIEFGG